MGRGEFDPERTTRQAHTYMADDRPSRDLRIEVIIGVGIVIGIAS